MPSQLAALIFLFFIAYLFWTDMKTPSGGSKAIWIPLIWMILSGSRFASQWINLGSPLEESPEGSPIDAIVFFILILSGLTILSRRQINWRNVFEQNLCIWLYFCFGLISIVWSDFSLISSKRLVKALGNVIMVMVILTDERPYEKFGVVLRRFTFLLIPLSVLFIKYYPDLGRTYHMGMPMMTGVATQKNGLGQICLLSFIYFSWSLILYSQNDAKFGKLDYFKHLIILAMIFWLLTMANSATSTACVVISVALFILGRQSTMVSQPPRIFNLVLFGLITIGILEWLFGISASIITMLGRKPDLTTRVPMWADLLSMVNNPIIGTGYESFWLGTRREIMDARWSITSQAHNGYLEMYLNMGLIGLLFIACWVVSGLLNIKRYLLIDYPVAVLRFCFVLVVLIYNWTEATFYGVNDMWILFMFGIIDTPVFYSYSKVESNPQDVSVKTPSTRRKTDNTLISNKNTLAIKKTPHSKYKLYIRKNKPE